MNIITHCAQLWNTWVFAGFIFPKYLPMVGGDMTLKLHESHILASTLVSTTSIEYLN